MALELEGRVKYIGPVITGESARGQWKKRTFVISTLEDYPRDVAFIVWNERAEALDNLKPGQRVLVRFRLESRQHPQDQSRWFTDATAWAIKVIREEDVVSSGKTAYQATSQQPTSSPSSSQQVPFEEVDETGEVDLEQEQPDLLEDGEIDDIDEEITDLDQEMDIDDPDIFDKEQEDDLPF